MCRFGRKRIVPFVLGLLLLPATGAAQRAASRCEESEDSPNGRNAKICAEEKRDRRGFSLFGVGDNAVAGLKASVNDVTFAVANSDIGDQAQIGTQPVWLKSLPLIGNRNSARFFELHYYATAGRGDFFRARDTTGIASLQNVRGGGYTFMSNTSAGGEGDFHTGKDGTNGQLFAGAKSGPGSCLDQSGSFLAAGKPLLAISDCPATWADPSWRGAPYFNQDSWIAYQATVGKAAFSFDFWKLPASLADPERQFIGTSAQTFGIATDHGKETRALFGSVIPGGRGDPRYDGYPLGLDWHFDAMTFNVTSVARLMVVQIRIVNRSADVYGTGIDYDSLFVGLSTRWLNGDGAGVGRRANVHSVPEFGAIVANENGRLVGCDGANVPSYIISAGCGAGGLPARSTAGFKVGATGVIYFKSPIGDLRNKLLSNPASPFYNPSSPFVGDTLTYNRMLLCGFDCSNVEFNDKNMQRSYGSIAAREAEALFGRPAPANMTNYDYWALMHPATGLDSRVNLTNPRGGGGFSFCATNYWRYTNRPEKSKAIPGNDTLFFDDCNPATGTRTALWADTLPDRTLNWAFNNTWSGAGPFPLKAGDTTAFVFGIFAAPDSAQFMQLMKDSYDFYLEFYLGPGVPGVAKVVSSSATGGVAGLGQGQVSIFLSFLDALRADASIPNTVAKLRAAAATSPEGKLRTLNPWLPDSIALKAAGLADTIYVFKSCNGGKTFTATKTRGICRTDRAVDQVGRPIGTGWQAYATLVKGASGTFPGRYDDPFVQAGQRYLYSFVTHRPALTFTVLDSGTVGTDPTRRLITRQYTVLAASSSSLNTTPGAPNVADVYVPVSPQAGSSGPVVTTAVLGPTPLTYHSASVSATGTFADSLRYTVFFGDTIIVEQRDAITRGYPDSTVIRLIRTARVGFTGTAAKRALRDTLVFRTDQLLSLNYTGAALSTTNSTVAVGPSDTIAVSIRKYGVLSAVVADSRTLRPFFASATLGTGFQPVSVFGTPGAPPLVFSITNRNGTVPTTQGKFWSEPGFGVLRAIGTPTITFITDTLFAATGAGYGDYQIAWRDTEFGPGTPFTLDFTNPAATVATVTTSLRNRQRADSTSVSDSTLAVINRSLGTSYTAADLVKLYVPFTVRNAVLDSTGGANRVTLAALRSSIVTSGTPRRTLLGTGLDTISVPLPDDVWVPGTPLLFIENVTVADTTVGGKPATSGAALLPSTLARVTFSSATIGCGGRGGVRCNPVTGRGESDYIRVRAQQTLNVRFYNPFTAESEIAFVVAPPRSGGLVTRVSGRDLDNVKVVPNPYVVTSTYEQGGDIRRLLFTHVPPQGILLIYTAAGTLVQQLTWTPEQLNGTGDLFWDMRTREGLDVAPGLYLFTVESTVPGATAKRRTPGRFIIIR